MIILFFIHFVKSNLKSSNVKYLDDHMLIHKSDLTL